MQKMQGATAADGLLCVVITWQSGGMSARCGALAHLGREDKLCSR